MEYTAFKFEVCYSFSVCGYYDNLYKNWMFWLKVFVFCFIAGATSEGVLANFFNSLLSKKTGSPGGPGVGGSSPGAGAGGGSSGLPPSAKKSGIVTWGFLFF